MNASLVCILTAQTTSAADGDEAVEAGREALDGWWGYPWYDAEADGVRRIEIPEPWDFSWLTDWWPDWDFSGIWNWWPGFAWPETFFGILAWTLLIAVLVGIVYLLVRTYLRRRAEWLGATSGKSAEEEEDDTDRIEALPFPVAKKKRNLLEQAQAYHARGNYAQAIVYLFSFELVQLDKHQIIRLTKGKTNRQYLREIESRRTLRQLIEQTMVAFEDVFFGNHPIDQRRFEACWSRLSEFESLAREAAA